MLMTSWIPLCFPVVLDEATSALSEETEELMYIKMQALGITFMSICHRSALMKVKNLLTMS